MARLLFPALNKLDAENQRLRTRVASLQAEMNLKTKERIKAYQVNWERFWVIYRRRVNCKSYRKNMISGLIDRPVDRQLGFESLITYSSLVIFDK